MTAYWMNPNVLALLRIEREIGRPRLTAIPATTSLLPWDEMVRQGFRDLAAGKTSPFLEENPTMRSAWNMVVNDLAPFCRVH